MDASANLVSSLEEIGLTKNESRVYLALSSLETATAYQIAQCCDVKKPTVYVTLEDLRLKGLVLKVPHAKKALFAARPMSEYLQEQKNRLFEVERALPQIEALRGAPRANVYFYSGLRGVNEATAFGFDRMHGKTFKSFYGNLDSCSSEIIDLYASWDKRGIAHDISFTIVMPKKGSTTYYQKIVSLANNNPNIKIRLLDDYIYPSNISFEIGEDFVRIIDSKNLYATIIDDQNTADGMRQIFDIVWEKGV